MSGYLVEVSPSGAGAGGLRLHDAEAQPVLAQQAVLRLLRIRQPSLRKAPRPIGQGRIVAQRLCRQGRRVLLEKAAAVLLREQVAIQTRQWQRLAAAVVENGMWVSVEQNRRLLLARFAEWTQITVQIDGSGAAAGSQVLVRREALEARRGTAQRQV